MNVRRAMTVNITPFVAPDSVAAGAGLSTIPLELVEPRLGSGAFGEVYLGRLELPGQAKRWVAVKLLKGATDDEQSAQRMRFEATALAQLNHDNVPTTHGLYTLDGRFALVTEYIDGEDLTACIHGDPPIPPSTMIEVAREVASALESAFQHDIVHRDVKPSNIRLGRHGIVKLLDFGVARPVLLDDREAQTETNTIVGTRLYLSPERLMRPNETPDPASDIFSLGCVLFEGITRHQFLAGLTFSNQASLSLDGRKWDHWLTENLSFLDYVEHVPDGVKELLRSMLAYRAMSRPSASEVIRRCDDLIQRSGARHIGLKRWSRGRDWAPSPVPDEVIGPTEDAFVDDVVSLERRQPRVTLPPSPAHFRRTAQTRSPSLLPLPALVLLAVLAVIAGVLILRATPEQGAAVDAGLVRVAPATRAPATAPPTNGPKSPDGPPPTQSPPPAPPPGPAPAVLDAPHVAPVTTAQAPNVDPTAGPAPAPRKNPPAEQRGARDEPAGGGLTEPEVPEYDVQFNSRPLGTSMTVRGPALTRTVKTPGHLALPEGEYRVSANGTELTPQLLVNQRLRVFWDSTDPDPERAFSVYPVPDPGE